MISSTPVLLANDSQQLDGELPRLVKECCSHNIMQIVIYATVKIKEEASVSIGAVCFLLVTRIR